MARIHRFLSERKSEAFSKNEIFSGIAGQASLKAFERALEMLAEIRAIDIRYVKGKPYYAYLEDLDRVW